MSETKNQIFSHEKLRGRENYVEWKFVVKNALIHDNLWTCISGYGVDDKTTSEAKNRRDEIAKSKICLSVEKSCFSHLMSAETAKDAWNALERAYDDKGLGSRVRTLQNLCAVKFENFANMEAYVNEVMSLAQQLANMNKPVDDEFLGALMLKGLPTEYEPMIMALEHSGAAITSDLVKSKLLQDQRWTTRGDSSECLYSTRKGATTSDSWTRKAQQHKDESKAKDSSGRKREPWCWKCRQKGHLKKDCRNEKGSSGNFVLTAFSTSAGSESSWYIDSGATNCMTGRRDLLTDFKSRGGYVTIASGEKLQCTGIGNVKLSDNATLTDVLYIPKLSVNLISVSQLIKNGCTVHFDTTGCTISNLSDVLIKANDVGGAYKLQTCRLRANLTISTATWHQRLGHLSGHNMKLLRQGLATDISFQEDPCKDVACEVCLKGKQARFPFPSNPEKSVAAKRLDLIHTDLCGPLPVNSLGDKRYILTFLDDHSRKVFVYFLKRKSEVSEHTKNFIKLVETQTGDKVKVLRSDNGTEYVNRDLEGFLKGKGIVHQVTVPYSPQQNACAERLNRTLLEKVRCLLYTSNLDHKFWAEAANTAVHLINVSPSKRLSGKTPEEAWSGKKVSLKHLRVFGCEAYAHVDKVKRNKLEPKSKRCIFLGYESNGYRLYDLAKSEVFRSRDVVFNETIFPGVKSKRTVEIFFPTSDDGVIGDDSQAEDEPEVELEAENAEMPLPPNVEIQVEEERPVAPDVWFEADEQEPSSCTDTGGIPREPHNDGPAYNLRPRIPRTMSALEIELNEPTTGKEALQSSDSKLWRQAMQDEIDSFNKHEAWELVDRPADKNIVKNRWLFKIKRDANGKVACYRARLVAKGFTQKFGIDYMDTYSPVVRHSSLRMLLSLAVELDLKIDHLDVKTAFLNGNLSEEIYMSQPEGFIRQGDEHKVYRLKKAVYGLKQASRAWYDKVKDVLLREKFTQSKYESCIFSRRVGKRTIIIALYVDDFFVFYDCDELAKKLKTSLMSHFTIKDLGEVKHMLGIKVDRTSSELKLNQKTYIEKLLERFGMSVCKVAKTPLDVGLKFSDSANHDSTLPYQELIGSLMYLSVTSRPDISYAASFLSQYNSCYTAEHFAAAKRVLRYLKGTMNLGLVYRKSVKHDKFRVYGFTDADWANGADRKSYTGYMFKLGRNVVSWGCYKQSCIALSSTEAEYIALSEAAKEAVYVRAVLTELTGQSNTVTLYSDNQSAAKLATNPVFHKRSKHVDIRYHYIREAVDNGVITLSYMPTEQMTADVLTKALPPCKHLSFVQDMLEVVQD